MSYKYSETISLLQFDSQMSRIFNQFGTTAYSQERKSMIWESAKRMPFDGFERVVSSLIATQKSPPLPSVFIETIHAEMRRWTRARQDVIDMDPVKCLTCNDLGIIRIQSPFSEEHIDEVMRCNCAEGRKQQWNLPQWVHEIHSKLFTRSACPVEWFKPSLPKDADENKVADKIHDKMGRWNQRIYKSQRYFSHEEGLRKGKEL